MSSLTLAGTSTRIDDGAISVGGCDVKIHSREMEEWEKQLGIRMSFTINAKVVITLHDGKLPSLDQLMRAWIQTGIEHPFLRQHIYEESSLSEEYLWENKVFFREQESFSDPAHLVGKIIKEIDDPSDDEEDRLLRFINVERDFSVSLSFLEFYRLNHSLKMEMYFCFSHSGLDGPGAFALIHAFLGYLTDTRAHPPRPFYNVLQMLPQALIRHLP